MICKCPKCDGALEYNPAYDKMECPYCGSTFTTQEAMESQRLQDNAVKMVAPSAHPGSAGMTLGANVGTQTAVMNGNNQISSAAGEDGNTMECNIYTCTACGAELAVNGVEASTFCAYCGQPTIVFSRVSQELMPKWILPFRIQKDQAVNGIREKLNKGLFVPGEIKNFEVEKVRGIYVPYFLFDVYYYDWQRLRGTVRRGKSNVTKYFVREAECNFNRLTCDASVQLNDESSQRLEPFDLRCLKPFEVGYLSGFYADRYDLSEKQLTGVAIGRTKALFDEEIRKTINASNVSIVENRPKYQIKNAEYALLPAWFMTFRYKNEPYTMLVNGQTGKVVGAVPFDKAKFTAMFMVLAVIATVIFTAIGMLFFHEDMDSDIIKIIMIAAVAFYGTGWSAFVSVKKNIALTKASKTAKFVRERQDDN
ncbi:MAG: hypothetical protein IJZ42_10975 [Lachnospiraceae bacterium]|nr:hypothetical protein [Lachnospiraceae bacterium]